MKGAYAALEEIFRHHAQVSDAISLLNWDRSVTMPSKGATQRAEQLAYLNVLAHGILTQDRVGDLLAEAENEKLDDKARANLHVMRHQYAHATALSPQLVERQARAASACEAVWREAKKDSDFSAVKKPLEEVLAAVRDCADAKAAALGLKPYDALLDPYDPGNTSAEIDAVFDDLEKFLPSFIDAAIEQQEKNPARPVNGPFPVEKQKALMQRMIEALGFDPDAIRLDVSAHPFSTGRGNDVRITTKYDENDFMDSLMSVLHECGHALFDRHAVTHHGSTPSGMTGNIGMTIHESQSLIVEKQLGRSRAFWEFAAPLCRRALGRGEGAFNAENLHKLSMRVQRGFIRIQADEATYPAHVILRYRLEKALIAGDLAVGDLPGAWNEGMKKLLGLIVPDHRRGCMQDIHWFDGAFGYFPTYALGAMAAAQLMEKMRADHPDLDRHIASGNLAVFTDWLRVNVQEKGASLTPREMMVSATGRPLDASAYKAHLRARYLGETQERHAA